MKSIGTSSTRWWETSVLRRHVKTCSQRCCRASPCPACALSFERGYAQYDAVAIGECLDVVATAQCGQLDLVTLTGEPSQACLSAIEPRQGLGDPCISDTDCEGGYCRQGLEDEGVCTPLPQQGESCDYLCAEPWRCGFDGTRHSCLPRLSVGEACDFNEDCESMQCTGDLGAGICTDETVCQGQ